jgi:general secretion pathway protein N
MRGQHKGARRISVRLALVLAPLLGVSASTSALPADYSDIDVPGFIEPASSRPLWESPAASAPAADLAARSPSPIGREAMRGNPLWAVPLAALSDTNERPIFSASRRRPPPPPVASVSASKGPPMPPSPPPVELRLVLVGTVIGDDQSVGIFIDETSKATLRLKLDGDYQGWRLRSVHRREVTMARGELTETLKLQKSGEGASVSRPAVAESAVMRGSSHTPQYD